MAGNNESAKRAPWQDTIGTLVRECAVRDGAERRIVAAVISAREEGRSWGVIGAALGVSKQAAQQRYGPACVDELASIRALGVSA